MDLFWLLSQGHVLLFADDLLVLPKRRKGQPPAPAQATGGSKAKRKRKKRKSHKARHRSPAKLVRQIKRLIRVVLGKQLGSRQSSQHRIIVLVEQLEIILAEPGGWKLARVFRSTGSAKQNAATGQHRNLKCPVWADH